MKSIYKLLFIGTLTLVTGVTTAATTVPNTFTGGTTASASEVNANFSALANAIDTLSARVDALENPSDVTLADLVGRTYCITNIGTISGSAPTNFARFSSYVGNYVLTIDSTSAGTLTQLVDKEHELGFYVTDPSPAELTSSITEYDNGTGTQGITINGLSNGILSTDVADFNLSSDGKAFTGYDFSVGTDPSSGDDQGENSITIGMQCPVVLP